MYILGNEFVILVCAICFGKFGLTFERNSDTHILNPSCKYELNVTDNNPTACQTTCIQSGYQVIQ